MSRLEFFGYFDMWAVSNFSEIVVNNQQGGIFKNYHLSGYLFGLQNYEIINWAGSNKRAGKKKCQK